MIVLVSGSREGFTYKEFIKHFEENFDVDRIEEIVAGGARGIDTFAKLYSKRKGIKFTEMFADWDSLGKKAGAIRNLDMLEYIKSRAVCRPAMKVIAFRFDHSSGTTHMIKSAKEQGIDLIILDKNSFDFG